MATEVQDPVLVNILKEVVAAMVVPNIDQVHYEPGRSIQILDSLQSYDNSITMKGLKYPLVAARLPIRERRGTGYYATAIIDRIVIANHVFSFDGSEFVLEKYYETGNFIKVLYPCYREFFKRLAMHPMVVGMDPDAFVHTKMDNPGQQPIGEGLSDYVDSIEILGLEITLTQIKNCI